MAAGYRAGKAAGGWLQAARISEGYWMDPPTPEAFKIDPRYEVNAPTICVFPPTDSDDADAWFESLSADAEEDVDSTDLKEASPEIPTPHHLSSSPVKKMLTQSPLEENVDPSPQKRSTLKKGNLQISPLKVNREGFSISRVQVLSPLTNNNSSENQSKSKGNKGDKGDKGDEGEKGDKGDKRLLEDSHQSLPGTGGPKGVEGMNKTLLCTDRSVKTSTSSKTARSRIPSSSSKPGSSKPFSRGENVPSQMTAGKPCAPVGSVIKGPPKTAQSKTSKPAGTSRLGEIESKGASPLVSCQKKLFEARNRENEKRSAQSSDARDEAFDVSQSVRKKSELGNELVSSEEQRKQKERAVPEGLVAKLRQHWETLHKQDNDQTKISKDSPNPAASKSVGKRSSQRIGVEREAANESVAGPATIGAPPSQTEGGNIRKIGEAPIGTGPGNASKKSNDIAPFIALDDVKGPHFEASNSTNIEEANIFKRFVKAPKNKESKIKRLGVIHKPCGKEATRGRMVERQKKQWQSIDKRLPAVNRGQKQPDSKEEEPKAAKGTKPRPFNLVTEERGSVKRNAFLEQVKEKKAREAAARILVAKPMPGTAVISEKIVRPPVKEPIRQQPFDLESVKRHNEAKLKLAAEIAAQEEAARKKMHFKARPITGLVPSALPPKVLIPVTEPESVVLNTSTRAVERGEFDAEIMEKQREIEERMREVERLEKEREELAIQALRHQMVPRARPMPIFGNPFHPKRSVMALTVPKSPRFHRIGGHQGKRLSFSPLRSIPGYLSKQ